MKEKILDYFDLSELEVIVNEWHQIDDEIRSDPNAYEEYDVTEESLSFIDRDIEFDDCTFIVTTDKATGKTYLMTGVTLWKDGFSIDAIDIDEIEQLVK